MIKVTKTFLPPIAEYQSYISDIWDSGWVTNHGPHVLDLESKLKEYLGVKHLFFTSNGTIAIQMAIKALELTGEIITTPFSYVATTSSIVWENCTPVFVDIDPLTMSLNPSLIESAITEHTTAIMAVHVYGNPCAIEELDYIARKHNLKIIYDAAHAFGVTYKDTSVLNFGDISTLSFHATKLFHSIEGGAVVTNNDLLAHRLSYLRNFGHNGTEEYFGLGVNGKNSEFHAAMGLAVLPHVQNIIAKRKVISELYDEMLLPAKIGVSRPTIRPDTNYNYAYYPLLFQSELDLLSVTAALEKNQILARRYFYPSLNTLPYVDNNLSDDCISVNISQRILCLPLYYELDISDVIRIANITIEAVRNREVKLAV